jgi:hypothetical protein
MACKSLLQLEINCHEYTNNNYLTRYHLTVLQLNIVLRMKRNPVLQGSGKRDLIGIM